MLAIKIDFALLACNCRDCPRWNIGLEMIPWWKVTTEMSSENRNTRSIEISTPETARQYPYRDIGKCFGGKCYHSGGKIIKDRTVVPT